MKLKPTILVGVLIGASIASPDWMHAASTRSGSTWYVHRASLVTVGAQRPRLVSNVRHEREGQPPVAYVASIDRDSCTGSHGLIELVGPEGLQRNVFRRGDGSVAEALVWAVCGLPAAGVKR